MTRVRMVIMHRRCARRDCDNPAAYIKRIFRWWWFPKDTWLCIDHAFADNESNDEVTK